MAGKAKWVGEKSGQPYVPMNNPVPIVPPTPSIIRCRVANLLLRSAVISTRPTCFSKSLSSCPLGLASDLRAGSTESPIFAVEDVPCYLSKGKLFLKRQNTGDPI